MVLSKLWSTPCFGLHNAATSISLLVEAIISRKIVDGNFGTENWVPLNSLVHFRVELPFDIEYMPFFGHAD